MSDKWLKNHRESVIVNLPLIEYGCERLADNFDERIDKIFKLFDVDEELGKIRKEQIKNHHYPNTILKSLEEYVDASYMCIDNETNKIKREYCCEKLMSIHSPVLLNVAPVCHLYWGEEYWREWNIEDIFRAYDLLIDENPQWLDYYTRKQLYENPIDCKQYMVLDMVNDLLVHRKILQYEHRVFDNLLESWDFENDKKVHIKINPNEKKYYLINDVELNLNCDIDI